VSTARGGEPSAFEPGLEHLIGALTASGHPHELAGRDAARAAFRAASQQPAQTMPAQTMPAPAAHTPARRASTRPARRRRPIHIALPARLAIAAVLAVLAGFTAAATQQVLPAPVQRLAYTMLTPLGVPVSQPSQSPHQASSGPGGSGSAQLAPSATASASARGGCPCPSASATSPSASATAGTHHPTPKATTRPAVVKP
jgi:hypothetical protein